MIPCDCRDVAIVLCSDPNLSRSALERHCPIIEKPIGGIGLSLSLAGDRVVTSEGECAVIDQVANGLSRPVDDEGQGEIKIFPN